jgi:hypothetical protein
MSEQRSLSGVSVGLGRRNRSKKMERECEKLNAVEKVLSSQFVQMKQVEKLEVAQ